MSLNYPDLPNTNFPEEGDKFKRFMDITASSFTAAQEYYNYYNQGDFENANLILQNNPILQLSIINADKLNNIQDATVALERFFLEDIENWIFNVVKDKGTWSNTVRYTKFDVIDYVIDNAIQSYQAITLNVPIGIKPTDTKYWKPITLRGKQGVPGIGLTPRGLWSEIITYEKDSMVVYDNSLWWAKIENVNIKPLVTSTHWELIFNFSNYQIYDNTKSNLLSNSVQGAIDELDTNINKNKDNINLLNEQMSSIKIPTILPADGGNADTVNNLSFKIVTELPAEEEQEPGTVYFVLE